MYKVQNLCLTDIVRSDILRMYKVQNTLPIK
uniref:Uncharacterized protein n=1 Tax=Siphoviridae sp. ctVif31 TaxID=2825532 RepID=A0A8S5Q2K8_9CAUD|nr:MAG TPA: hypothetical protein [Siphoviridae sp. ctVif31]